MFKYIWEKLNNIWQWIKRNVKKVLISIGIVGVAAAATVGAPILTRNEVSFDKMQEKYNLQATTTEITTLVRDKYVMENTSLVMPAKNRNAIKVALGDKTANTFLPELEIAKWEDEVSFKLKPNLSNIAIRDRTLQFESDKILLATPKIDYLMYDILANKEYPEGAYEFEIVLKEKPVTNIITLNIETEGLDFYYQPAPTQQEIDDGTFMPDNVVGSYAVYNSTKQGDYSVLGGKNYMAGKAFHIYRPKIIDSIGSWVWGELNVDELAGTLTITTPQIFLDKAVYPVSVDPTFGYTSIGASSFLTARIRCYQSATTAKNEDITSISTYGRSSSGTNLLGAAIYEGGATGAKLAEDDGNTSITISGAWRVNNITYSAIANTPYTFCAMSDQNWYYYEDSGGGPSGSQSRTWEVWPDPLGIDDQAARYSIYATYTCNSATASNFTYYKKGTVDSTYVSTTTDVSVIVASTTDADLKHVDFGGNVQSATGDDIAFFDNDQATLLDFEIESYSSTTGAIVAWIRVTDGISSTTDQDIYIYYGDADALNVQCVQEVWGNATGTDPVGVWHLPETPTVDSFAYDSTQNNYDGTFEASMTTADQIAGNLDGAIDFDGTNDTIQIPEDSPLKPPEVTFMAWVYQHTTQYNGIATSAGGNNGNGWVIRIDNYDRITVVRKDSGGTWRGVTLGGDSSGIDNWRHVAFTSSDSALIVYVNGVEQGSDAFGGITYAAGNDMQIGFEPMDNGEFDGFIDEVRIYNIVLTADDITTIYNMESDNSTFLTWGAEQTTGVADVNPTTWDFWIKSGKAILKSGKTIIKGE